LKKNPNHGDKLKTTVEKLSPTRVKLTIEVDQAGSNHLGQGLQFSCQPGQCPGFPAKGAKVPSSVLDQRVGKDSIIAQAINDGMDSFTAKHW